MFVNSLKSCFFSRNKTKKEKRNLILKNRGSICTLLQTPP